jgi:O-Antigen ligase
MATARTGSNIGAGARPGGDHDAGRILAGLSRNSGVQIGVVLVGGLVLLHGEDRLTPAKLAYLIVTAGVVLNAMAQSFHLRATAIGRSAAPLVVPSLVLLGMLGISYLVAAGNDATASDWLRDSSPYLLLAATPFLAVSLRGTSSPGFVEGLLVATGGLTAISFWIYFASRRDLPSPGSDFLLPSFYLPAALFAYATTVAIQDRRRAWLWTLLALGVLSLIFLSGTRTTLIFLAAPLVVLVLSPHRRPVLARIAVALIAFVVAWTVALPAAGVGTQEATERLTSTPLAGDQSLRDRSRQTEAARRTWEQYPILGVGPGHFFEWSSFGYTERAFAIDSPVSYVAKFGVLGLLSVVIAGIALTLFCRQRLRDPITREGASALAGFAAIAVAGIPFGVPLEDKGFAFGSLLLLTLALPDRSSPAR